MQARPNHTFTPNYRFLTSDWNEFVRISTTTTWHVYNPNGLIATHTGVSSIKFPLKDHLGSPRMVLKQDIVNGDVTELSAIGKYSWHPFGGILNTFGVAEPQYGFTGQEKDYESDLHNFRARQYNESLGRFYSVDPQGQYHSPYVYGGNNPFSFIDPDGENAFLVYVAIYAGVRTYIDLTTRKFKSFGDMGKSFGKYALQGTVSYLSSGVIQPELLVNTAATTALQEGVTTTINNEIKPLTYKGLSIGVVPYFNFGTDEQAFGLSGFVNYHNKDMSLTAGGSGAWFNKEFGTGGSGFGGSLFAGGAYKYYDDESIGYSTTKYFTGNRDGSQRIGTLAYSTNGTTLTYSNDHFKYFADNSDRFRTASVMVSNSGFTVGTKLFTEDYGKYRDYKINDDGFYDISKSETPIYRSGILYAGYKGYQVGFNNDKVRDIFQNQMAHKFIMNAMLGKGVGYFMDYDYGTKFYFQNRIGNFHPNGY